MMWRYAIPIVVFVGLGALFWNGLGRDTRTIVSPYLGKPAPEFELPQLENPEAMLSNATFGGRTSLLNIWATWCPGCRDEHPFLNEISASSGVPIYGLNWKDDRASALNWLDTLGNPYAASGYDPVGDVGIDWGAYAAPETFLIGRDGTVLYKHIAPLTPRVWQTEFIPRIAADCGSYPCK